MKKSLLALLIGLLMGGAAMAQTSKVVENSFTGAEYSFTFGDIDIATHTVQDLLYDEVTIDGSTPSPRVGLPNLPVVSKMIEIPLCGSVKVTVSDVETVALPLLKNRMMPAQPSPSKSDREPRAFVIDSEAYAADSLFANPAATVEMIGVARDRNLAILRLSPLAYNPATGEMVMIKSLTVRLTYQQVDAAATLMMSAKYYSPDFTVGGTLLSTLAEPKAVRNSAPLHYLIVAHSMFRGQLDEFIAWKKRQGFIVTAAYTDDPGVGTTSTAIASYIKGYYTNATAQLPAPTYLLLVGDHAQIPAFTSRCTSPASDHVTDLYYTTWTDGDVIPDCYIGRFSARNAAELKPQTDKSIYYERYDFAGNADNYLERGILIAGEDRGSTGDNAYTYADPAMDYVAKTYVNAENGFSDVRYYKNNTSFAPAGVTVTGSSQTTASANALRSLYNTGYGLINYSAHGYDDEWSTPEFTSTHASNMTNSGKPSIMIGNCCLSGKFNSSVDACLGEAVLRKGNNAGAVAYIGGTNSTYWPQDFCWSVGVRSNISNTMNTSYDSRNLGLYDKLFHTHNESYTVWHNTTGAMVMAGNNAVQSYGTYALYYWEIYELFGDPSLMPWIGKPATMNVEASSTITLGTSTYTVQAVPRAYVAITTADSHSLVCAAYADATTGEAELTIPDNLEPDTYELVVWAQNYKPFFQEVSTIILDGPFLKVEDIAVRGGRLKPGCVNTIDVTLKNIGTAASAAGTINFTVTGEALLLHTTASFSAIAADQTTSLSDVCRVYVPAQLTDGDQVTLTLAITYGAASNSRRKTFTVSAPRLEAGSIAVSPVLQPSTQSNITCTVTNSGSDTARNLTFTLVHPYDMVAVQAQPIETSRLIPGESSNLSFAITMDSELVDANLPFELRVSDGAATEVLKTFVLRPGTGDIDDFESATLTHFNWVLGTNPWVIASDVKHDGNNSARSARNLSNNGESRLSVSWSSTHADSVRFWYKVSSETNYDKFTFTIDGTTRLTESGEVDWTRFSYPVSAGTHTFAFVYKKDVSRSSGSDCVWIDDVVMPSTAQDCEFRTDTVCQGAEYTFGGNLLPTDRIGTAVYRDTTGAPVLLSLTVVAAPTITIHSTGNVEAGHSAVLTASGASAYEWSTGATTPDIVVTPVETTRYSVVGALGQCTGEASIEVAVGIKAAAAVPQVTLFPNPTDSRVTVRGESLRSIAVTNAMGQTVLTKKVSGDEAVLDLHSLAKGIYFVRVEADSQIQVKKLVRR